MGIQSCSKSPLIFTAHYKNLKSCIIKPGFFYCVQFLQTYTVRLRIKKVHLHMYLRARTLVPSVPTDRKNNSAAYALENAPRPLCELSRTPTGICANIWTMQILLLRRGNNTLVKNNREKKENNHCRVRRSFLNYWKNFDGFGRKVIFEELI
jgi:hypothetical protein